MITEVTLATVSEAPVMTEYEAVTLLGEYAEYIANDIVQPAVEYVTDAIRAGPPPKEPWEMLGEYLREAAVLVLVFVPIELLIPKIKNTNQLPMRWFVFTLALSLTMLFGGMWCERRK
jgi:hypothetical protein